MKKLRGLVLMLLISLSLFGLTACQDGRNSATYEQITPQQAKEIMDTKNIAFEIGLKTKDDNSKLYIQTTDKLDITLSAYAKAKINLTTNTQE